MWSGAMTRYEVRRLAISARYMKDQVGLPCNITTGVATPFIDIVLTHPRVVAETTLEWKEVAKRLETHRHSTS